MTEKKPLRLAMTQNFVRIPTEERDNKYLSYKVKEEWEHVKNRAIFAIGKIQGYHGTTVSLLTPRIYDKYRIFDDGKLVAETEDVVCELPTDSQGQLSAEAFTKDGEGYYTDAIGFYEDSIKMQPRDKKKNYKLSVVVPLYNSELFMCRTIDSILLSTLDSIELILIDDGSTDGTWEIAQRYVDHFGCVRAYHQENQGVSITRNRGLELATGEFIAFCDNDDIIHPEMYEKLYNACKKYGSDIAIAQTLIRKDIEDKEYYLSCKGNPDDIVVYTFDEMMENRGTPKNIFFVAVWNKIVKTEIARMAKFPTDYTGPGVLYEDVAYTGSLYSYIDKFVYVRDAYYTWDKRKQKTVGTASTWHSKYDNEYVWKMFIYGFSYMLYNKSGKHLEWHDYTHFKRLIESYDKFDRPSPLRTYRDEKLKELVNSQKLYDNKLIMANDHLREVVERVR